MMYLIIIFALVIFFNDQGKDIIQALLKFNQYWVWTFGALFLWGISIWYCCHFLLKLKEITHDKNFGKQNKEGIEFWLKYLPDFLGISPPLLMLFRTVNQQELLINLVLGGEILLLLTYFFLYESIIIRLFGSIKWLNEYSIKKQSLSSLLYFKDARIVFWSFTVFTCLLFVLSLSSVELGIAVAIGPLAVFVFGFVFLTPILTIISYLNIPGRRPFFLYLAVFCIFFSQFNDNSLIQTLPLSEKFKRPTIEQDFQSWMTNLKAVDTIQTAVPIIFIAAEGGGLRGTIWTGLFLDQMEKEMPGIHKNIYAISGVSGGGVGATFYISNLYDKLKSDSCGGCANQNFRKTIRADFLSDVLAASLFQDNIQKFIPIGINSFNRTRRLEEAWSKSFRENNNSLTFDKAFTQLWQDTASRLPRLFINGVLAETGQKTIVSYPCINRKETNDPFQDEIDVIAQTGSDMPVKTAASLCSRFPYITSGGLIQTQSKIPIGHVIDGGYKENTGLETIWQILLRLKPAMANVQKINEGLTIRPIIIFIKNSPSNEVLDKNKSIANLMHEINIPIIGFMNAAFRISTKETLTEKIFKDFHTEENKPLDPLFFTVALERSDKGLGLPLGWYFSEESFNYVDVDINRVFSDKKHKMHELRRYFPKK